MTNEELQDIRERYPRNPDIRALLVEVERIRTALAAMQAVHDAEIEEFNEGYAAREAGLSLDDEPHNTCHDQWRIGWVWAYWQTKGTDREVERLSTALLRAHEVLHGALYPETERQAGHGEVNHD